MNNKLNVLKYEFSNSIKSSLIWGGCLSVFMIIILSVFSGLGDDLQVFSDIISDFPPEYQAILGISPDSITSIVSLLAIYFSFFRLAIAIQAGVLGLKMLTYEESQRTADFLLSKPITRNKMFVSKLIASLGSMFVTILIFTITTIVGYVIVEDSANYQVSEAILVMASMIFTQLFVFGLTLMISLLMKKVKGYIGIAMGISIGLFALDALKTILDMKWLGYINPYSYFVVSDIIADNGYNILFTLISLLITIITIIVSWFLYSRRDINQVS